MADMKTGKQTKGDGKPGKVKIRLLFTRKTASIIGGMKCRGHPSFEKKHHVTLSVKFFTKPEGIVSLDGRFSDACTALKDIVNHLQKEGLEYNDHIRLLLHHSQVEALSAQPKCMTRQLRQLTGAHLKVFPSCCPKSTDRVIQIGGTASVITEAVNLMLVFLKEVPPVGETKYYVVNNFDEELVGRYGGYLYTRKCEEEGKKHDNEITNQSDSQKPSEETHDSPKRRDQSQGDMEKSQSERHADHRKPNEKLEKPRKQHSESYEKDKPRKQHSESYENDKPRKQHSESYENDKPRKQHSESYENDKPRKQHSESHENDKPRKQHSESYENDKPRKQHSESYENDKPRKQHSESYENDKPRKQHSESYENDKPRKQHSESYENDKPRKQHSESYENDKPRKQHSESYENDKPRKQHSESYENDKPRKQHSESYENDKPHKQHSESYENDKPRKQHSGSYDDNSMPKISGSYNNSSKLKSNRPVEHYRENLSLDNSRDLSRDENPAPGGSLNKNPKSHNPPPGGSYDKSNNYNLTPDGRQSQRQKENSLSESRHVEPSGRNQGRNAKPQLYLAKGGELVPVQRVDESRNFNVAGNRADYSVGYQQSLEQRGGQSMSHGRMGVGNFTPDGSSFGSSLQAGHGTSQNASMTSQHSGPSFGEASKRASNPITNYVEDEEDRPSPKKRKVSESELEHKKKYIPPLLDLKFLPDRVETGDKIQKVKEVVENGGSTKSDDMSKSGIVPKPKMGDLTKSGDASRNEVDVSRSANSSKSVGSHSLIDFFDPRNIVINFISYLEAKKTEVATSLQTLQYLQNKSQSDILQQFQQLKECLNETEKRFLQKIDATFGHAVNSRIESLKNIENRIKNAKENSTVDMKEIELSEITAIRYSVDVSHIQDTIQQLEMNATDSTGLRTENPEVPSSYVSQRTGQTSYVSLGTGPTSISSFRNEVMAVSNQVPEVHCPTIQPSLTPVVTSTSKATSSKERYDKVRDFVSCKKCEKPRCVYSDNRLTSEQSAAWTSFKREVSYSCGFKLLPKGHPLRKVLWMEAFLKSCSADVNPHYYGNLSSRKWPLVCYKCGKVRGVLPITEEDRKQWASIDPVCVMCSSQKFVPRKRRRKVGYSLHDASASQHDTSHDINKPDSSSSDSDDNDVNLQPSHLTF